MTLLRLLSVLSLVGCSEASDQRCLLEGGGSTDTFFVREDSEVGEEVGRIRVNGELVNCHHHMMSHVTMIIKVTLCTPLETLAAPGPGHGLLSRFSPGSNSNKRD